MTNITVIIEDYIPTLDETDVEDLIKFSTELFCIGKIEVQND